MDIELVFIPSPGDGHFRSTAAIAKLLVDSHDHLSVTLIVIPSRFSADVSPAYPESEGRLRYYHLPATASDQSTEHTIVSYIESQKPHVRATVSELSKSSLRLAGIVLDMFCMSMSDIADEFGLPTYTFYTSNASYLGLQLHLQSLYDAQTLDVTELKDSDDVELDVPTLTRPLPVKCLPSVMFSKDWFPYVLTRARSFRASKGILVNSMAELEPQALKFFSGVDGIGTPPVYAVGPIMDLKSGGGDDEKEREILCWLNQQPSRSVLFLCFGSMGGFNEKQTRETAVALERSGHRFLWSLRRASPEENMKGHPSEDFANLEEILPEGFLDRTAEIGKIIRWAPQVDVLRSRAVGGFVTHCGWNSVLESLWFGVPTAAWPIFAEQQFNAFQMVVELGLAAEIRKDYRGDFLPEPEFVTAEEIESGISCVMEQDSELRKRVKEMSDKLHVALMDGGSSKVALRKFVQDVIDNVP